MRTPWSRLLPALLAFPFLSAPPLSAQRAARTPDEKWSDLVQLDKVPPAVANRADATSGRQAQQAQLQAVATAAEKFVRDNPAHAQVAEARRLEAKSRLISALLDPDTPAAAVQTLATDVRSDSRLPAAERYEVAFLAEMAREKTRPAADHAAWLAAREQSARTLIAEFPHQAGGYSLLLQVAGRSPSAAAAALAKELVASAAPAEIKIAAQQLSDRQSLVGQTLAAATAGVLGAAKVLEPARGKPLILYTWRPENTGSIALAQELPKLAPADAVIIGVNLSPDVPGARIAAGQLPGVQLYGGRGFDSPLVRRLGLTSAPMVCLVDRQGVIRSTDAQNDLAGQIASLEGKP